MAHTPNIDGVLVQWGDRLFYPGNRIVKGRREPRLDGGGLRERAAAIRQRIEATVVRRVPQVMVKVTEGGRGMLAIAAHFRYFSKNGRLDIENEQGETVRGKGAVHELADDWRFGGGLIDDVGYRREAFNIKLWRLKASEDGRMRKVRCSQADGPKLRASRAAAVKAWVKIGGHLPDRAMRWTGNWRNTSRAS